MAKSERPQARPKADPANLVCRSRTRSKRGCQSICAVPRQSLVKGKPKFFNKGSRLQEGMLCCRCGRRRWRLLLLPPLLPPPLLLPPLLLRRRRRQCTSFSP